MCFTPLSRRIKNPKVAVALILENGGSDGVTAAPVMRQIMDHLFAPQ
ncbi:penicillin-binding protein 2 [Citrobacter koseri]|nr:penicillin-binding protein 2 [Citrobacter koseri]